MDNSVATAWATSLPNLRRIELLGPFLVRAPSWQTFFRAHPDLEGFLITQSPRFDIECMQVLVDTCKNLKELRLKDVGKLSDEFLECLKPLGGQLTYLDLSYSGASEALSEKSLIDLLRAVGSTLEHLNLTANLNITDALLFQGIKPHVLHAKSLILSGTSDLTDAGVAEFFQTWKGAPLAALDLSRNHELADAALVALLAHSGATLVHLNVNGWKEVSEDALKTLAAAAPGLQTLDVSWCRAVDDWVVKSVLEHCTEVEEIKVWGCQRLSLNCPRKVRVCGFLEDSDRR